MKSNKQFWLSYNNGKEKLQLPLNPEVIQVSNGSQTETITVRGLGDYTIIGDPRLRQFSLNSQFPDNYFPGCEYPNIPLPRDAVTKIEKWKASGNPIRFIITNTPWNYAVTIEDFNYEEQGGDVDSLYYTLVLQEYRFIKARKLNTKKDKVTGVTKAAVKKTSARPVSKVATKTYTVVKGDSLSRIGIKTGVDWRVIADLNNLKAPYNIQIGKVLRLK